MKKRTKIPVDAKDMPGPGTEHAAEETMEETRPPVKKNRKLKTLLHICLAFVCVLLVCSALIFVYDGYTKTHYEITF